MDIDPSIRINAINYANRPNVKYAGKRQTDSNLSNPPMKAQRNFHVSTSPEEAETSFDNKDNTPPITFEQYGTTTATTTSTTIYVLSSSSKTTTTPSKTKYFQQTTIPTWTEATNRIIPIPTRIPQL
ncbi:unnamed protein product [Ceratitis capitata]|uniref:(Mediterranean fruit fly) hypothetical protein n=1 Tax=Ceratitis capitata TaxID=7213 RepID=A0A811UQK9_CERCA|nr:unnamed protein product [Ceratitis capitata]